MSVTRPVTNNPDAQIEVLTAQAGALNLANPVPPEGVLQAGNRAVRVLTNVHNDDIHALIRVGNFLFSGSKDGSIKQWDLQGNHVNTIEQLRGKIDYKKWITAFSPLNDRLWMSGRRNGDATVWTVNGEFQREVVLKHGPFPEGFQARCKDRNIDRINCLASFTPYENTPTFFAGFATQFTTYSLDLTKQNPERRLEFTHTSKNDWVYTINTIDPYNLLVVTGTQLDYFSRPQHSYNWKKRHNIIAPVFGINPRPFISAVTRLNEPSGSKYGLAVFDGSVRVIDIQRNATVNKCDEHAARVWAIENISENVFASCGDDGFIKLWDIRVRASSIASFVDNVEEKARVSVLKLLNEHELLSGSCPDDVRNSVNKGQFSFWDTWRLVHAN